MKNLKYLFIVLILSLAACAAPVKKEYQTRSAAAIFSQNFHEVGQAVIWATKTKALIIKRDFREGLFETDWIQRNNKRYKYVITVSKTIHGTEATVHSPVEKRTNNQWKKLRSNGKREEELLKKIKNILFSRS